MKNTVRFVLTGLVVLTLVIGTLAIAPSGFAQQPVAPLYTSAGVFVPGQSDLKLPANLTAADYQIGKRGYYIVQFSGPVEQEWKDALTAQGAELLNYQPDFAFKVRMNPSQAKKIQSLSFVSYVGIYQPAFKLSAELVQRSENALTQGGADALYMVRVERGADFGLTRSAVAQTGAQVLSSDGDLMVVLASPSTIAGIAGVLDVASISEYFLNQTFNNVETGPKRNDFSSGSITGAAAANARGYDGSTQTVAVADTGLGGGTAATAHRDMQSSRIAAIYNWTGVTDSCFQTIYNDGAVDVDSGHGTHTAGSVLSSGAPNGIGKGSAPAAHLVFQATENYVVTSSLCKALYGYPDGYYLTGLPADLTQLYQQAYAAGARVHSNSWGSAAAGDYSANSATTDTFIWNNRDMVITFSAGNEGIDANANGVIDNDSIGAPATAKNVITVGASENQRSDNYLCDTGLSYTACAAQGGVNSIFTWGSAWPADYPANPIKDDVSANNAQQMAAFSSRGPTDDGRIKPDVVAPGSWILSAYSDMYQQGYDAATNPRNNTWQYDGYGFPYDSYYKYMSGTSMSNPLTAGGAAVVKDYFQKAYSANASAALVKGVLINTAVDMADENNDGLNDNDFPIPNSHEGWGLINLDAATNGSVVYVDEAAGLATNATQTFNVTPTGGPLKVTVVWSDYPSTAAATINLVNDLDLTVSGPSGTFLGNVFSAGWSASGGTADRRNNVENVYLASPAAGAYTVTVRGFNVPSGPQKFALVVTGGTLGTAPTPTPGPTNTPTNTPVPPTPTNTGLPPTPTNTPAPVTSTGFRSPSANAAVTSGSGDNNGFQTTPANAYLSDNLYAVDTNSGSGTSTSCTNNKKDRHIFSNFNFNLPVSAVVKGVEVKVEGKADSTASTPKFCVELSWNGGATWTTAKSTTNLTTADVVYTLGTSVDTWGHVWTLAETGNTSFRVRIVSVSSSTSRDFSLDAVTVNVHYQP